MTAEKALELLNDVEFSEKYQGVQEYAEMLIVCKEALEKQIPRKCRIKGTAKLQTFYCPTCEQVVVSRIETYEKPAMLSLSGSLLDDPTS